MSITALPSATVRLLGSAQVLTTPTSLIKELIDNALDAKATSVDILISKNTLDKLEVRDNGHGISSEDFQSLGKHGHTSKLRSFEELRVIGGVTLGFRGEALASAVELGDVSITTKTEGEAVATKLALNPLVGVHQQSRTSHPVGTTVTVLKFMYKIPVRKQTYEKEAPKTLAKINQLLRSYALARPSVRFSLKIMNGEKGSWSFAPRPIDGIKEAVSQVIGRDAAIECFEKSFTLSELQLKETTSPRDQDASEGDSQETSQLSDGSFAIEAFLPKADADISKVGTGQYLSIDSRPVSHEKGTMKKIVTMFKKYIRGALSDPSEKLKNPFIRLNIKCPIASYDANVEPAKDDVLFGNEPVVLEIAESLMREVYGDLKLTVPQRNPLAQQLDDFEFLLARSPAPVRNVPIPPLTTNPLTQMCSPTSPATLCASSPVLKERPTAEETSITEMDESGDEQIGSDRRKWGFDMSRDFSEDVDDGREINWNRGVRPNPQPMPDREISSANPLNPWIIAKLTAPIRRDRAMSEPRHAIEQPAPDLPSSPHLGSDQVHHQDSFVLPNTRLRQTFRSDDIRALQPSIARQYPVAQNRPEENEELTVERPSPVQHRRRNDFLSARDIPDDVLISPPPPIRFPKGSARSRGPNKPFVSPLITSGDRVAPSDRFVQTTLFENNPRPRRCSDGGHFMPQNEASTDVEWAMDYEQRKQDATRRRREELHLAQMEATLSSSVAPLRSSPHKNRYNAAIASLEASRPRSETSGQPEEPFKITLPEEDPRGFLMRRQKSLAAKKVGPGDQCTMRHSMSRAKSRLPLEKTPEEQRVQNLVYNLRTDIEELKRTTVGLARSDMYVGRGNQSDGLMMRSAETVGVAMEVKKVVGLWMKTDEGKKYEVEYMFDNLLQSKSLST